MGLPDPLLSVRGLRVEFTRRSLVDRLLRRAPDRLTAVDGVDLDLFRGEAVGLVGESGCGKSTLARSLVGIQQTSGGSITLEGGVLTGHRSLQNRRKIQMVFQDPYSSLNPRMRTGAAVREVLAVHGMVQRKELDARVAELFEMVGLSRRLARSYPRALSGGQRQRVSIARALALGPEILIADEPVSALDVSVRATVLNLLADLRDELGLTLLFIAHDLSVVRHVCDRVAVMYLGRIVESSPTTPLFAHARHPYTQGLVAAAPSMTRDARPSRPAVSGDPPSPYEIPTGCRFHPRCPISQPLCSVSDPVLEPGPDDPQHSAACHFAWSARPSAHVVEAELDTLSA